MSDQTEEQEHEPEKVGWIGLGIGVVVIVVAPLVKKLMHLDTLKDDELDARLEGREELGEPQAAGIHPGVTPTRPA